MYVMARVIEEETFYISFRCDFRSLQAYSKVNTSHSLRIIYIEIRKNCLGFEIMKYIGGLFLTNHIHNLFKFQKL